VGEYKHLGSLFPERKEGAAEGNKSLNDKCSYYMG
jgi:hypothetical protein